MEGDFLFISKYPFTELIQHASLFLTQTKLVSQREISMKIKAGKKTETKDGSKSGKLKIEGGFKGDSFKKGGSK